MAKEKKLIRNHDTIENISFWAAIGCECKKCDAFRVVADLERL